MTAKEHARLIVSLLDTYHALRQEVFEDITALRAQERAKEAAIDAIAAALLGPIDVRSEP